MLIVSGKKDHDDMTRSQFLSNFNTYRNVLVCLMTVSDQMGFVNMAVEPTNKSLSDGADKYIDLQGKRASSR